MPDTDRHPRRTPAHPPGGLCRGSYDELLRLGPIAHLSPRDVAISPSIGLARVGCRRRNEPAGSAPPATSAIVRCHAAAVWANRPSRPASDADDYIRKTWRVARPSGGARVAWWAGQLPRMVSGAAGPRPAAVREIPRLIDRAARVATARPPPPPPSICRSVPVGARCASGSAPGARPRGIPATQFRADVVIARPFPPHPGATTAQSRAVPPVPRTSSLQELCHTPW